MEIDASELTEEEIRELCDAWERRGEVIGISITRLADAIYRVKVAVHARREADLIDHAMSINRGRAAIKILRLG